VSKPYAHDSRTRAELQHRQDGEGNADGGNDVSPLCEFVHYAWMCGLKEGGDEGGHEGRAPAEEDPVVHG